MRDIQTDWDLLSVAGLEACRIPFLLLFNGEADSVLRGEDQQRALRMRRRIDYMLTSKDEVMGTPFRFVVQHAGDLPTVSWILHGGEGEVYQAVLMMTNITNQYIVLWYVEVAQAAKDNVYDCFFSPFGATKRPKSCPLIATPRR